MSASLTCGCRKELESKLAENFKAKNTVTDVSVELQGYGFGVSDKGMTMQGVMPYKLTFLNTSNNTRRRTVKGNMIFSYCPFCRKKGE